MEKESTTKRCGISLPGCVTALLVFLVVASLSMSAVVLWQLDALKRGVRDQEVTIRKLQASKNNVDSKRRDLESLQRTVQMLTVKVPKETGVQGDQGDAEVPRDLKVAKDPKVNQASPDHQDHAEGVDPGREAATKTQVENFSESAHIEGYGGEINPKTGISRK
ncbi:hypothetical protein QZH41_011371, partial [Actinostola sp. cb2023]